ncbi:MAG: hypothetical protein CVV41_02960 [Candidatus Riflebacteria bacterium HGW-Riflebacteria-1]|jgi:hypothetical protein|nr:MAG: hypothetical protein CVV41_02960 [Candidatus Riflebacteria bacterium HGW-Riflebacteria-1]
MLFKQHDLKVRQKGFVLYVVCALLLATFILVIGFEQFRSGSATQLAKTIEQEKMISLAQVGVNEILADIKSKINNRKEPVVGSAIYEYWKSRITPSQINYAAKDLSIANSIAASVIGKTAVVTGSVRIVVDESIGTPQPSYIGYVEIESRISASGLHNSVKVLERRELKIVDLSDSFLDKYALYVKSFCRSLNVEDKKLSVKGVLKGDKSHSLVYLGRRNAPTCSCCSNILLDVDFNADKNLLASYYNPTPFTSSVGGNESSGNFFWTKQLALSAFADKFSLEEYEKIPVINKTLDFYWKSVAGNTSSVAEDVRRSGPVKFKNSVLNAFKPAWNYYYGYTDYLHFKKISSVNPFRGLKAYFAGLPRDCFRHVGGKMPAFFGEDRSTPVFIEGPVYLRFFKVAFVDEVRGAPIVGQQPFCSAFELEYSADPDTLAGKVVGSLDPLTRRLGSHPIDDKHSPVPVNSVFYELEPPPEEPKTEDNTRGFDIFPRFHSSKLVANFYLTPADFYAERVKTIGGVNLLDLDGICTVLGTIDLDRGNVTYYRGRGTIVTVAGDCILGNLKPFNNDHDNNYLKIYLTSGGFGVTRTRKEARIEASLVSTFCADDNSQIDAAKEGTFNLMPGQNVHIFGNLVVDALPYLDSTSLTVEHSASLIDHEYPVRASVGSVKTMFVLDYSGEE